MSNTWKDRLRALMGLGQTKIRKVESKVYIGGAKGHGSIANRKRRWHRAK